MATTQEADFSFPAAADSSPDSPPLWRRSATAPRREVEEEGFTLPSFQAFRFSRSVKERKCNEDGEEKMDMLWEDLNEDRFAKSAQNSDVSSPRREVQMSCVRGLRLSRANGHIISHGKKTSILVFIKALKKVFLMHNSQRAIKKKPS
ncbi:uncharacterized protein LOC131010062 [Salvia miltiorrhiza]|uniref:uncharacterized protein LOC131010062 n=1 Tax=Salvia miltiorrhiza TaxID=226208 RepID=UPI0025ABC6C0|nr:uncharacterized protein LOC131010062 [Salvia miltiorrhiza]